jgi:hypothetical protein
VRDEFHQEKNSATGTLVTRTPYEHGSKHLLNWISLPKTQEWTKHHVLKDAVGKELKPIALRVHRLVENTGSLTEAESVELKDTPTGPRTC